jgi:RNA polymerase primary sigma factor
VSRYYDSVAVFMREIGGLPLLTAEEEIQLAAEIKAGSSEARERLITHNIRLVWKVAQQYVGRGVEMADLVSWGTLGMMRATESYDGTRGVRFSGYACYWIRQRISREIANCGRTVRAPIHMGDKLRVIWRAESKLTDELGRQPSEDELAAELDISPKQLSLRRAASISMESLDAPIHFGETDTVSEVVGDGAAAPDEVASKEDLIGKMLELVGDGILSSRERLIIEQRFGLNGEKRLTLQEVGEQIGRTRERSRQIERAAIVKLRQAMKEKDNATVNMYKSAEKNISRNLEMSEKVNGKVRSSRDVHHQKIDYAEARAIVAKAESDGLITRIGLILRIE